MITADFDQRIRTIPRQGSTVAKGRSLAAVFCFPGGKGFEMVKLNWRHDPDAEFVLGQLVGITWLEVEFPLSQIDWKESANNCARLKAPLLHEVIEEYHASQVRGDVFPMVVVEESENGFIILGGNQRCNAAKLFDDDKVTIKAYVVEPLTSSDRELIIRSLNSRHGHGATKDERIEHAVFLVQDKGVATLVAARAMCVSESVITSRIRCIETRAELARKGVDSSKFSWTALESLARVKDVSRKVQVAKAVEQYKPASDDVASVVSGVLNAKTDASAQKVISNASTAWATSQVIKTTAEKGTNSRRKNFLASLQRLVKLLETGNAGSPISTLDDVGCSVKADLESVRVLVAKITSRLNCIVESGK